jgi:pilus assembly protein CpaB
MKTARLVVLGCAILAAAGAAMLMAGRNEPPPPVIQRVEAPAPKTEDVLVAAADLPMGQTLRQADLRWVAWPADSVPTGFITRSAAPTAEGDVTGSIARHPFLRGEPIRREKLIRADGGGFMSAILPSGMRAVAITIDTRGATSAGGFILPNDRVDVIRTYRDDDASRSGGGDTQVSETLLNNIRVLAIGQTVQERNGEKVVTGETATLELTPAQAELVTLAQKVGQLSLALRSLVDANQPEAAIRREETGLTVVRYGVAKQAPKR